MQAKSLNKVCIECPPYAIHCACCWEYGDEQNSSPVMMVREVTKLKYNVTNTVTQVFTGAVRSHK